MWGVTVKIGAGLKLMKPVTIFLHKCWFEDQTFMYTSDISLYYSFYSVEEARIWFLSWYEGQVKAGKYLPDKKYFEIVEIPGSKALPTGDNEPKSTDKYPEIV